MAAYGNAIAAIWPAYEIAGRCLAYGLKGHSRALTYHSKLGTPATYEVLTQYLGAARIAMFDQS